MSLLGERKKLAKKKKYNIKITIKKHRQIEEKRRRMSEEDPALNKQEEVVAAEVAGETE